MENKQNKKTSAESELENKIDKLLFILNNPETNCVFWKIDEPNAHIMGIRPVQRTTIEVINENGFNPFDKKTEEKLFKCFKIYVLNNKSEESQNKEGIDNVKEIEKNGIMYIKSYDLIYIVDKIRKST